MADLAGSRVITEDELDSTTLRTAVEEILGIISLPPCKILATVVQKKKCELFHSCSCFDGSDIFMRILLSFEGHVCAIYQKIRT